MKQDRSPCKFNTLKENDNNSTSVLQNTQHSAKEKNNTFPRKISLVQKDVNQFTKQISDYKFQHLKKKITLDHMKKHKLHSKINLIDRTWVKI